MTGESTKAQGKRPAQQSEYQNQRQRQRTDEQNEDSTHASSSKRKFAHTVTSAPTRAMAPPMSLRFLGTSSSPNFHRNYSSLLLKFGTELLMVDCGEGTQQRFQRFGPGRMGNIRTILITHLHQDHVLGLVPFLTSMGGGTPQVNIYGPLGLRALIRTQLTLCYTNLDVRYAVHELIWPSQRRDGAEEGSKDSAVTPSVWKEPDTPLAGATLGPQRTLPILPPHDSELPGSDIVLDEDSCTWPEFTTLTGDVTVSAAPVLHRCPTLAYVIKEPPAASPLAPDTFERLDANAAGLLQRDGIRNARSLVGKLLRERQSINLPDGTTLNPPPLDIPGRKVTVCGDTSDATGGLQSSTKGLVSLAHNSSVLVHECTNASLSPWLIRENAKSLNVEDTRLRAQSRGHSTPQVAGEFAGRIHAQALLLNHFSVRYNSAAPEIMSRVFANSSAPERTKINIEKELQVAEQKAISSTSNRGGPDDKFAVLKNISDQTTKAWHESMQDGETALLPQDESLPTRASVMQAQLWKKRRAVPTWDGFEYHILRDDELLSASQRAQTKRS